MRNRATNEHLEVRLCNTAQSENTTVFILVTYISIKPIDHLVVILFHDFPVINAASGGGEVDANLEEVTVIMGKGLGITFCLNLSKSLVGSLVQFQF